MLFTSLNFLLFFPSVLLLFYLTPLRYRWITLLAASYFFYINIKPVYALLTACITVSTYIFTQLIDRTEGERKKKAYMTINIILVLLPLMFFKYFHVINSHILFFIESYNLRWPLPEIKFLLPLGISFYTFMCIGYTIDVYNEKIRAESNIGLLALFVSFFPLILSGPIERAGNMLPQFRDFKPLKYENITAGMKMMLWGYFMKLVVADRIGIYVDVVYGNISLHNGSSLLIASVLYPFQVYADLGGYSLIAIGVARVMGIRVMQNFNRPFFATSMAEFWRRWHISLITWLTDYVYTPLSFSFRKFGIGGIIISLMLTFFIAGIWHDAKMTYVFWGLLQGIFLSVEALTYRRRTLFEERYHLRNRALYLMICMITTFILFATSQVFGRADTIGESWIIFSKIFSEHGTPYLDLTTLLYSMIGLSIVLMKDFFDEFDGWLSRILREKKVIHQLSYAILFYLIIFIGVFNKTGSFIYFKF